MDLTIELAFWGWNVFCSALQIHEYTCPLQIFSVQGGVAKKIADYQSKASGHLRGDAPGEVAYVQHPPGVSWVDSSTIPIRKSLETDVPGWLPHRSACMLEP